MLIDFKIFVAELNSNSSVFSFLSSQSLLGDLKLLLVQSGLSKFFNSIDEKINEFRNQKAPEFYNQVGVNYPELEKEKWDVNIEKFQKEADEALGKYTEVLEQLESEQ